MWNYLISFGIVLLQEPAPIPTASPASTPLSPSQNGEFGSFLWLMLGIGIGFVIGILVSKAFSKPQSRDEKEQPSTLSIYTPPRATSAARSATLRAKRCPVCKSTYTDEALIYCVSDGASLVSVNNPPAHDSEATILYPETRNKDLPPTQPYRPEGTIK